MFTNANLDAKARELRNALDHLTRTITVSLVFENPRASISTDPISEYDTWDIPDWLASFVCHFCPRDYSGWCLVTNSRVETSSVRFFA